jgi:hypothetical protein
MLDLSLVSLLLEACTRAGCLRAGADPRHTLWAATEPAAGQAGLQPGLTLPSTQRPPKPHLDFYVYNYIN